MRRNISQSITTYPKKPHHRIFQPNPTKMKYLSFLLVISMAIILCSCTGGDSGSDSTGITIKTDGDKTEVSVNGSDVTIETDSEDAQENIKDAMNKMQDAMKEMNNGEKVEVINFRELQELLPEKLNGYERVSKGGETAGAMGMNISTAKAKYEKGDQKFEVNIVDTGGFGMAMMSMAAWSQITVDREDENGYERTTTIDGNKCYEQYKKNGDSQIAMIIDDRFIITGNGDIESEKDMKELRGLIDDVKSGKLKAQ